jgi:hypothetical protein
MYGRPLIAGRTVDALDARGSVSRPKQPARTKATTNRTVVRVLSGAKPAHQMDRCGQATHAIHSVRRENDTLLLLESIITAELVAFLQLPIH